MTRYSFFVTDKVQNYRANMFQIAGFAFMTPLGSLVINLLELKLSDLGLKFVFYLLFTLLLSLLGIIFLVKGMDALEGKG